MTLSVSSMEHLAGIPEIAAMLDVSRQRVYQLIASHPDFPEPVAELAAGRIWQTEDIEAWLERHPERRPRKGD